MSVLVILMAMATSPDDDDAGDGDGDDVEEMEIIAMVIESLDRHTHGSTKRKDKTGWMN